MQKTIFKNIAEFIAEISEAKPLIEEVAAVAQRRGDRETLAAANKLLTLFADDCAILRETARRVQKQDGRVEIGMSQDVFTALRKMGA